MPELVTPGGVLGRAPFLHRGRARHLVHLLKYHADFGAGSLLVGPMLLLLDPATSGLVPVPRARLRRLRYGIDPARWLAGELSRRSGIPVVHALRPQLWWPSHAASTQRRRPEFRLRRAVPLGSVLVDDVVTSGATLDAAAAVTGAGIALTATTAPRPKGPIVTDRRVVG